MMNEYKIMWEQFLKESPWATSPTPNSFNDRMENFDTNIIGSYDNIGNFEDYEVYQNDNGNELFFMLGDDFVAYYRYEIDDRNVCHTKMTWNHKNHQGTFLKLFGEYLIPKFKIIESDDMMTPQAFSMWQKLIGHYTDYKYYVKTGDELIPIDNPYEVHNYSEKLAINGKSNSTFLVTV
jgi:hypothetical protein